MYNEAEIIEGCRKNIPEFQKIVYEKYAPKMIAICMRYIGNYEEARDLMHDGFIKVFMNFKSYRQESNLDSWITRVVINNTLSHIRKRLKTEKAEKFYEKEKVVENTDTSKDNWFEKFSTDDINTAILQLSLAKRAVFNLYVIEDYSHKDIAQQLGISIGTSKSHLSRAKETLKHLLLMKLNREK